MDGVLQAEENRTGGVDKDLVPYAANDMGWNVTDWFGRAGAFPLRRKTYEIFAFCWSRVTGENNPVDRSPS
jgi:hypothetical protein